MRNNEGLAHDRGFTMTIMETLHMEDFFYTLKILKHETNKNEKSYLRKFEGNLCDIEGM